MRKYSEQQMQMNIYHQRPLVRVSKFERVNCISFILNEYETTLRR